jgi:hypothetical protein
MSSNGYLLDFPDFKRTLSGIIQDPDAYQDIAVSYLKFDWQVTVDSTEKIAVAIGAVRQASIEEAYEHFKNNHRLHEEIYHRAMSIWR